MRLLTTAWDWIVKFLWRTPAAEPAPLEAAAPPQPPEDDEDEEPAQIRPHRREDKKDLVHDLKAYMRVMRRLSKCDPDGYATLNRIGARLVSRHSALRRDFGKFPDNIPSIFGGGIIVRDEAPSDKIYPRFGYVRKLKGFVADLEVRDGDLYEVCILMYADDDKWQALIVFHVNIGKDGKLHCLKRRVKKHVRVKNNSAATIPQTQWRYPWVMEDKEWSHMGDAHARASHLFSVILSVAMDNAVATTVRATYRNTTGLFAMSDDAAKHLFKDRVHVILPSGRRKPIYHWNSGTAFRRGHFKGLRSFDWHGFKIHIRRDDSADAAWELPRVGPAYLDAPNNESHTELPQAAAQIAAMAESVSTKDMNLRLRKSGQSQASAER